MKLVVGLGNPGKDYDATRHNIGFMVLDFFVSDFVFDKKFQAMIKKTSINGEDVMFVKPFTYMNLSGEAVIKIVRYFHISLEDILIIHDDLDLILGKIRFKINSSSGGHNGVKSIIQCLKSQNFCRMKVGILYKKRISTIDYVLQKFSNTEQEYLNENYPHYQAIIYSWITDGVNVTMNKYNNFGGLYE